MRKYLVFILFFIVLALGALVGAFWYFSQTAAPTANSEEIKFVITKGSSATKIAKELKEAGLIKSALAFKVYSQLNGISDSIPPGSFLVPQNLNLEELVSLLRKGPTELWVTIPEGLRREQFSERFADTFELSGQEAIDFRTEFLSLSQDDEGYLFPDTYLFPKDATPAVIVSKLKNTFGQKTKSLDLTREEVILASILERETLNADEGPLVAGILLKRAAAGWPLQADATAQYVAGTKRCSALSNDCEWWKNPTSEDLAIVSPYNTYKQPGFPPAPISNAGLAMLTAAANPESSDFWYYLHDSEGVIHYGRTLEEHNANISRYLR